MMPPSRRVSNTGRRELGWNEALQRLKDMKTKMEQPQRSPTIASSLPSNSQLAPEGPTSSQQMLEPFSPADSVPMSQPRTPPYSPTAHEPVIMDRKLRSTSFHDIEKMLKDTVEESTSKVQLSHASCNMTEKDLALFSKAVTEGNVDARGPLAQRLSALLAKSLEEKAKYKECRSDEERRAFRLKWATTQYEQLQQSRSYSKSFQNIDTTKGEMMSFGRLVETFGIHYDREHAIECATTHALKCANMGGSGLHGMR